LHTFKALNDQCTGSAETPTTTTTTAITTKQVFHFIAFSGPQGTPAGGKGRQSWKDS